MRILNFFLAVFLFSSTHAQVTVLSPDEKHTNFIPNQHGFNFENSFKNKVTNEIVTGGRCYGMIYAALDYYNKRKAIPRQDYRPADNTVLSKYLYDRQIGAMTNINVINKFSELGFNPFGNRTTEFFNWGLQGFGGGRLEELRKSIDAGKPVPLGLYSSGSMSYDGAHHAVLAIGYKLGNYKGDLKANKEDLRIFIYDPNHPNIVRKLKPNVAQNYYVFDDEDWMKEEHRKKWMTYFVDQSYGTGNPPTVAQPRIYPNDGKAYELLMLIKTGGDDLRGGNDNVNAKIHFWEGPPQVEYNINARERWVGGSINYVSIPLKKGVAPEMISHIVFETTFSGGTGGDNWDFEYIRINSRINNGLSTWKHMYCTSWNGDNNKCDDKPLKRFTGSDRTFEVKSPFPKPAPTVSASATPGTDDGMQSIRIQLKSNVDKIVKGNKLIAHIRLKNGTVKVVDLTDGNEVNRGVLIEKIIPMGGAKFEELMNITIEQVYGEGFLALARWRLYIVNLSYYKTGAGAAVPKTIFVNNNSIQHDFKSNNNKKLFFFNQ